MSENLSPLRLGTRGSPLALWQANWIKDKLEQTVPHLGVALVTIKTTGDRILDVPLAEVGGKRLFIKELDEALLDERIDFAVHSLKDLPFELVPETVLAAVPEREDPRDVLVSDGRKLSEMPTGARIGTSSLRRQAQLRNRFRTLKPVALRGNVDTRLRKLDAGEFDGILLAAAGMKRLGYEGRISEYLDPDVMLPAIGQGALALVCRGPDVRTRDVLDLLDHPVTHRGVLAERALMASVEGNCQVPIGGYARVEGNDIVLKGLIAGLDGETVVSDSLTGGAADPEALGFELGSRLRREGGDAILEEIQSHGA